MILLFLVAVVFYLIVAALTPPRRGYQHHNHSAFYDAYIQSPLWQAYRRRKFASVGYRCHECGRKRMWWQLDCHHNNYDRLGHELLTDTDAVCRGKCHRNADQKRAARSAARRRAGSLLVILVLTASLAHAQNTVQPNDASQIIREFQDASLGWLSAAFRAGTDLFGLLAIIECAVAFGALALGGGADLSGWVTTVTRKVLVLGGFYALLLLGPRFMQSVIDSFQQFGQTASGVRGIEPTDILADGIDLSAALILSAVHATGVFSLISAIVLAGCSGVILWAFVKLVKAYVIIKVEAFITICAAAIQLGWGASRWTSTYAERYVGGAIANGVRLMAFYLIIGGERKLYPRWVKAADNFGNVFDTGLIIVLTLAASVFLFVSLTDIEKWAASIFGGVPSFTGHDITNAYMPFLNAGVGAAVTAGSFAYTIGTGGAGAPALLAAASGAGGTASSFSSSLQRSSVRTVPPPMPRSNGGFSAPPPRRG